MQSCRTLNIAHIHTVIAGSGGDRVSELEAQHLVQRGHTVTMVGPVAPATASTFRRAGIAIYDRAVEKRTAADVNRDLGKLDIVHCHCMVSAPFAAELAQEAGAALVLHNHSMGEEWWECSTTWSRLRSSRRHLRKQIDAAVTRAHRILCVSESVADHMRELGLRMENASIVPNPVGAEFFREEAESSCRYDVCVVARPSRAKRPFTTLRVLARARRINPNLRMVWLGELGRWSILLKSGAVFLGLRELEYRGSVKPSAVSSVLDSSRVLFSASSREGQPLAVLEALVRGCSVVLSDIPAHRVSFSRIRGAHLTPLATIDAAARLLVTVAHEHIRTPRLWLTAEHSLHVHGMKIEEAYREAIRLRGTEAD